MTDDQLNEEIQRLVKVYGPVDVSNEPSGQKLVLIKESVLPKGCTPESTKVLLRITFGQPRPEIFVQPGIKVGNGKEPRSTTTVPVSGESWLQFSYSFPWDENKNTLEQFVASNLQRFAKPE